MPVFEDRHPIYNWAGYGVTNEEPDVFIQMLSGKRLGRAMSIASGGEVPLFVLLPKCEQVVAVDHSYRSLAVTWAKAMMLDIMGPDAMKRLFEQDTYRELTTFLKGVKEKAPEILQKKVAWPVDGDINGWNCMITSSDFNAIRREMHFIPRDVLRRAQVNLHKLMLIHGDFRDVKGAYNTLYLSNALEHSDRDGRRPPPNSIDPFVMKGGLLLSAGQAHLTPAWKNLKIIKGFRTSWDHKMHLKTEPPVIEQTELSLSAPVPPVVKKKVGLKKKVAVKVASE